MALKSIQLCHLDPVDRTADKFSVTINDDAGEQLAIFDVTGERNAVILRNGIREHADRLRRVADYRTKKPAPTQQFNDGGDRHRLVSDDGRVTDWVGYQSICLLDGFVGHTAYYGVKEGVCTAMQFVEMSAAGQELKL